MDEPNQSKIPTYQEWLTQKLMGLILTATEEEARVLNAFVTSYFSGK